MNDDQTIEIYRERDIHRLKMLLWIYLFLLFFEGSVRKWVPGMSAPFLVVRDPIALFIWIYANKLGIGSRRAWLSFYIYASVVTLLAFMQIIGVGILPAVALFGWRSYVLHVPVIIAFSSMLTTEDIGKIGKWVLLLSIPLVVLMIFQYEASPSDILNRGATAEGGQITGALGHIRPAGTFSYILGPVEFMPLVGVFLLWAWTGKAYYPRWLVAASSIALVAVQPISVSRSLVLTTCLVLTAGIAGIILRGGIHFKVESLPQIALGLVIASALVFATFQIPVVVDAVNTFSVRWTLAQGSSGDNNALVARVLDTITAGYDAFSGSTVLGRGIGEGSNFAAALQNIDQFQFGEGALDREMVELGVFVGTVFVALRFFLALYLIQVCLERLRTGAFLCWFLMPLSAILLVVGSVDQTTVQGFLVAVVGINCAAIRLRI